MEGSNLLPGAGSSNDNVTAESLDEMVIENKTLGPPSPFSPGARVRMSSGSNKNGSTEGSASRAPTFASAAATIGDWRRAAVARLDSAMATVASGGEGAGGERLLHYSGDDIEA